MADLPTISELGLDLLLTSRRQQWWTLGRPFGSLGLYVAAVALEWWPITPVLMFGVFVAMIGVAAPTTARSAMLVLFVGVAGYMVLG